MGNFNPNSKPEVLTANTELLSASTPNKEPFMNNEKGAFMNKINALNETRQKESSVEKENLKAENLLQEAQAISDTNLSKIEGEPISKQGLALTLLNSIPFFSSFLHSVDGTGMALSQLAALKGRPAAQSAAQGFHIGGLVLAAADFVRIPFILGASRLLGIEAPITLSKSARWLYSGVVLGLTITAFVVPAAAPAIALGSAAMGLTIAVFTFGKHFYEKHKTKKELKETQQNIKDTRGELEQIKNSTSENIIKKLNNNSTQEQITEFETQLKNLQKDFETKKEELKELKTTELHTQKKLEKLGWSGAINKGTALGLTALALAGIVTAIFIPPVGLAIVATSAAAGALYFVGAVGLGVVAKIFKGRQKTPEPDAVHSSLSDVATSLAGKNAAAILQGQGEEANFFEKAMQKLSQTVKNHDTKAVVNFFKTMAQYTSEKETKLEDIQQFQKDNEIMQPAVKLFKQAVENGELKNEDLQFLQTHKVFVDFLEQEGIKLPQQGSNAQEEGIAYSNKNTTVIS